MTAVARCFALAGLLALSACGEGQQERGHLHVPGGDPATGRNLIQSFGCVTCHVIEGVRGPRGTVGPVLEDFAQRKLLAGVVPNTPAMLVSWLMDPPALVPTTGMPAIGLNEQQARHVAAYLLTLGAADASVYPRGTLLELRGREEPVLQSEGLRAPADAPNRAREGSL
jgi:cytochrome c2